MQKRHYDPCSRRRGNSAALKKSLVRSFRRSSLRRSESRDGDCDGARPQPVDVPFGRGRDRGAVDDVAAGIINATGFVPGAVWIEVDAERRCQHGGGEIFRIIATLELCLSKAVIFRNITIDARVGGASETNARISFDSARANLMKGISPGRKVST